MLLLYICPSLFSFLNFLEQNRGLGSDRYDQSWAAVDHLEKNRRAPPGSGTSLEYIATWASATPSQHSTLQTLIK